MGRLQAAGFAAFSAFTEQAKNCLVFTEELDEERSKALVKVMIARWCVFRARSAKMRRCKVDADAVLLSRGVRLLGRAAGCWKRAAEASLMERKADFAAKRRRMGLAMGSWRGRGAQQRVERAYRQMEELLRARAKLRLLSASLVRWARKNPAAGKKPVSAEIALRVRGGRPAGEGGTRKSSRDPRGITWAVGVGGTPNSNEGVGGFFEKTAARPLRLFFMSKYGETLAEGTRRRGAMASPGSPQDWRLLAKGSGPVKSVARQAGAMASPGSPQEGRFVERVKAAHFRYVKGGLRVRGLGSSLLMFDTSGGNAPDKGSGFRFQGEVSGFRLASRSIHLGCLIS